MSSVEIRPSLSDRKLIQRLSIQVLFLLTVASTVASAEQVKIPWKRDYTYTAEATYSPENKHRSGLSRNFLNGAPEEGGKVQRDGVLTGEFIRPKGPTGPVPVMILMHGCSGLTPLVAKWAKEKAKVFLDQGVGVLILDSFGPRKVVKTCGAANYHWGWRRVEDAYSALNYLIASKLAIPDRVYVMGRSNGATAALMIANSIVVSGHIDKFAGSFAVSPACVGMDKFSFAIPATVFTGDRDMANDPKVCAELDGRNGMVRVVLFKGVHHGFEDRTATYVFNGWRMEYNAKADQETIEQTLAAIKR